MKDEDITVTMSLSEFRSLEYAQERAKKLEEQPRLDMKACEKAAAQKIVNELEAMFSNPKTAPELQKWKGQLLRWVDEYYKVW